MRRHRDEREREVGEVKRKGRGVGLPGIRATSIPLPSGLIWETNKNPGDPQFSRTSPPRVIRPPAQSPHHLGAQQPRVHLPYPRVFNRAGAPHLSGLDVATPSALARLPDATRLIFPNATRRSQQAAPLPVCSADPPLRRPAFALFRVLPRPRSIAAPPPPLRAPILVHEHRRRLNLRR